MIQVWTIHIVALIGQKKNIPHLRTSYDFAHLADLTPVVQKMDNPIQSINLYPVDSAIDNLILIYWIVIYLLDSANQGLYNRRQYFIAYIIWLLDIACLFAYSKRSFLLYFFSHLAKTLLEGQEE